LKQLRRGALNDGPRPTRLHGQTAGLMLRLERRNDYLMDWSSVALVRFATLYPVVPFLFRSAHLRNPSAVISRGSSSRHNGWRNRALALRRPASLAPALKWLARIGAPAAAVAVSAGFFGVAFSASFRWLVYFGAALLLIVLVLTGIGLLRNVRASTSSDAGISSTQGAHP
jgi:hypothetical protein